jgi:long-chain acyl-CoA synthetase
LDEINYTEEIKEKTSKEIYVFMLSEIMQKGSRFVRSWPQISNNQTYCICYTSGTTGNPRGSIITHKAILSVILTTEERF